MYVYAVLGSRCNQHIFGLVAFNNPPRQKQPKQQVSDAFSRQRQSFDQWQRPRGHGGVER